MPLIGSVFKIQKYNFFDEIPKKSVFLQKKITTCYELARFSYRCTIRLPDI